MENVIVKCLSERNTVNFTSDGEYSPLSELIPKKRWKKRKPATKSLIKSLTALSFSQNVFLT